MAVDDDGTRPWKIQDRKATNRKSVANAFAPTNAAISVSALAPGAHAARASNAPVVSARPRPKTARPCICWVTAPARPRTPKVNRRLAAVLATAVATRATKLAPNAPNAPSAPRVSA